MMDNTHVVTSCSLAGWEKYGKRFVETFEKFWPTAVGLHVVSEDVLPVKFSNGSRFFHNMGRLEAWRIFKDTNASRGWTQGDSTDTRPPGIASLWTRSTGYNFRFDAFKFSKKVFAIELIAEDIKVGRLLWLDADTLTHSLVPMELPAKLLPANYAISCLSRVGYHSECGFVGYNLSHQQTHKFIRAFSDLYTTGQVFDLSEWHDSWVFDWLRNRLMISTYNIPHKSKGHPFINSELGLYLDHLKGRRKDGGRTAPSEQVTNAHLSVPYWQGGHRV